MTSEIQYTSVTVFTTGEDRKSFVPVGVYTIAPDGTVSLRVLDDKAAYNLREHLNRGVLPPTGTRAVMPSEGSAFLHALVERCSNTTYWRAEFGDFSTDG